MANLQTNTWKLIRGQKPILLVESHNFPQLRGGIVKPRDIGTGIIVEKICNEQKTFGLISKNVQIDPNWYTSSSFRQKVKKTISEYGIALILDIHGKKAGDNDLVEYLPNRNFIAKHQSLLKNKKVDELKDDDQLTLAEDLDLINIPSVEIEIRRDGRIPGGDSNTFNIVIKELGDFVSQIYKSILNSHTPVHGS